MLRCGVTRRARGRAWRGSGEHPFLLDNVYDLQRLLDYLEARPDVDPRRIGVTGISLGGMHSWLLAAVDERVAAAAPMIGVQVPPAPRSASGDSRAGTRWSALHDVTGYGSIYPLASDDEVHEAALSLC